MTRTGSIAAKPAVSTSQMWCRYMTEATATPNCTIWTPPICSCPRPSLKLQAKGLISDVAQQFWTWAANGLLKQLVAIRTDHMNTMGAQRMTRNKREVPALHPKARCREVRYGSPLRRIVVPADTQLHLGKHLLCILKLNYS